MEISLENLYVYIGAQRVNPVARPLRLPKSRDSKLVNPVSVRE